MGDTTAPLSGATAVIWMLVCVVLIVGLAYWFTKHVVGHRKFGKLGSSGHLNALKVLDRVAIGREQQLVLVRVGDKLLLLGVTNHLISKLAEFSSEDAEWAAITEQTGSGSVPTFGEALKKVIRDRKKG